MAALDRVGIAPVVWLAATPWATIAVIAADVWNQTPFVTLLLLAGLQSIPEEYYEAARVDGASAVLRFLHVTLPLLAPVVFVAVFWRFVATFRGLGLGGDVVVGGNAFVQNDIVRSVDHDGPRASLIAAARR